MSFQLCLTASCLAGRRQRSSLDGPFSCCLGLVEYASVSNISTPIQCSWPKNNQRDDAAIGTLQQLPYACTCECKGSHSRMISEQPDTATRESAYLQLSHTTKCIMVIVSYQHYADKHATMPELPFWRAQSLSACVKFWTTCIMNF